jgi:hypothetical protein
MTSSCDVLAQVPADGAHRGMKKKSHVARGEIGDSADFLVAQATVKLEEDDFALIARERLEYCQNPSQRLTGVVLLVQVVDDGHLGDVEGRQSRRLLPGVQRKVPAHREQPGGQMLAEVRRILPAQPQKCLLHDIPRQVEIAKQPRRIANQWSLVAVQGFSHPFGMRRAAHLGLLLKITDVRRLY